MLDLVIACPETGKPLKVGFMMTREEFESREIASRVSCPHCRGSHTWTKQMAWLDDDGDPPSASTKNRN